MSILLTGCAGFIGYHVAEALLARGESVIGVDNLNDYYDVGLKEARLARLLKRDSESPLTPTPLPPQVGGEGLDRSGVEVGSQCECGGSPSPHVACNGGRGVGVRGDSSKAPNFQFHKLNIADKDAVLGLVAAHPEITGIINLAAQAGVRYSLVNPYAYVEANVMGHLTMLEAARSLPNFKRFVYASSSSVYGCNEKIPFAVGDAVERPASLYAVTKRADELMSWTYAHLYGIPCTGLRFFTVYGPWGRPDMAAYIFTRKILADEPIEVFNNGKMRRDFTYIDDIARGVLAALDRPAGGNPPARIYNLGNSRAENLMDFIAALESALGKKAIIEFKPMQAGDVPETFADISASVEDLGYAPTTTIGEGVPRFVEWYRGYHA